MSTGDENTPPGPATPDAAAETAEAPAEPARPRQRGFAAMDRARLVEISKRGGRAVHDAGTAHEFSREDAREAGRKGGRAHAAKRAAARTKKPPGSDSGTP